MSHDHFNNVIFIRVFEDFNKLNVIVIVEIVTAVVTSQTLLVYFSSDIPSQNSYLSYRGWCS